MHPALQPEAHHLQQRLLHRGAMQVQIGLRGQEVVQVILLAPRIPGPGRTAEHRQPVVRRRAIGLRIGPDIPVGLVIRPVLARLGKPGMRVRGMAQHQVDHHLQVQRIGPCDHRIEIRQRAEHRIDIAVIADVIAEVLHRAGEERADPDRIRAQTGDMRQALHDAAQIANAIAVRILKTARIDLIDDGTAPPVLVLGHRHFTDPASSPRTRYFCIAKNTSSGTAMDTKAEVARISQSPPRLPSRFTSVPVSTS